MSRVLDGLNTSQVQAVTATDRHVLVVAGPGTGKTLTIVRRIAHLLEQGVEPDRICAVTFTNRAAREMRERITALLGAQAGNMFIGTFHLLGLKIIRESLPERLTICGREEQLEILKPMVNNSARAAQQMAERIAGVKGQGARVTGGQFKPGSQELDGETRQVYAAYQAALKQKGLCDFDDLISIPIELFETDSVAANFPSRFKHIIVDEYQDISPAQYRLLKCLVSARDGNTLCTVGDSDQAIYAFRGADLQNFLNFQKDFSDAVTVVLKENYRSTNVILGAADAMIKNNQRRIAKEVKTVREAGGPIAVISVPDERAEAEAIVQEIDARMGGTTHYRLAGARTSSDFSETSYGFSDFAVLFRTNAQAKALREAFDEWGIPCQVIGERHPLNRAKLIENLRAHVEVLPERIDLATLLNGAAENSGASSADYGLLETLAAVYQHLPPRKAITEIINELTLLTTADAFDPRADAVALMTVHMAKGLEFKLVFIAGCEDGLLPFTLVKDETDIEEERRLFYVGMTRAKDELFLLHARSRFLYGQRRTPAPSPFLAEIPAQFSRTELVQDEQKRAKKGKQTSLF
jgi:DNA helicase II / ATP-dependent DNA helicase PcrA